jgi:hypothetical protein
VGSLLTFDIPQTALVATLDTYDLIVWIDSFFELRCYGAMSFFSVHRLSWWFKISFNVFHEIKPPMQT